LQSISVRIAVFHGLLRGQSFALQLDMTKEQLQERTKRFGLDVITLIRSLPRETAAIHIARQLVRSGTAVGSNYRASCRAKSKADFISKMAWVEEEGDESLFWMEMLVDSKIVPAKSLSKLMDEANQLVRIAVASINTARGGPRE
jgi:four helix bundle protein